jgi:hypothetical protein
LQEIAKLVKEPAPIRHYLTVLPGEVFLSIPPIAATALFPFRAPVSPPW